MIIYVKKFILYIYIFTKHTAGSNALCKIKLYCFSSASC